METYNILVVEDSEDDLLLLLHELEKGGMSVHAERVDSPALLKDALTARDWKVVIADMVLPSFDGLEALRIVKESRLDLPFIIVSGKFGEETAVEAMKAGAHDYFVKGKLARLVPAIKREIEEAGVRRSRQQALEELERREADLNEAQRLAKVGSWELIPGTDTIVWSEELARIAGRDNRDCRHSFHDFSEVFSPESWNQFYAAVDKARQWGTRFELDLVVVRPEGTERWVTARGEAKCDDTGSVKALRGTLQDITERKQYEEQVEYQANHDGLTGLPNRVLLVDRIEQAISSARRYKRRVGLLFIDLDQFKLINDTLGHDTGDVLLKDAGTRIMQCVRSIDTVARHGGDEFVVVLPDLDHSRDAAKVADRINRAMAQPFHTGPHQLVVTCSIGISIYPKDGEDTQTLLKKADIALYRAKEQGRDNFCFYTAELNQKVVVRMTREKHLRRALERDELLLHYQPQIDLADGKITGTEALLRWHSHELGKVATEDFISIAEETGLIVPIGEWAILTACRQNKEWQDQGFPPLSVAVNISPRQFAEDDLPDRIALILDQTSLHPLFLELEIPEEVVTHDVERGRSKLWRLKELGVKLTMDDFGKGFSNLTQLQFFPFDKIKIDKSFIRSIRRLSEDVPITRTIFSLAQNLNLRTIAEGVEVKEQLDFVRAHACDEMQGYYFSRPLAPRDFELLLMENGNKPIMTSTYESVQMSSS